jgi:large subunit ribosomal protein L18
MGKMLKKLAGRNKIRTRIRSKIKGTSERPRISVFRSNRDIYAQIVDDVSGITIASCSSRIKDINSQAVSKVEKGRLVGQRLGEIAKEKGVEVVVFDRGGYQYHGRVKALAEGVREAGLKF